MTVNAQQQCEFGDLRGSAIAANRISKISRSNRAGCRSNPAPDDTGMSIFVADGFARRRRGFAHLELIAAILNRFLVEKAAYALHVRRGSMSASAQDEIRGNARDHDRHHGRLAPA